MHKSLIIGCLLIAFCGCAQLRVSKITSSQRASGCDSDVKGMRYYLSRPYVCIKKPILVTTTSQFYLVRTDGTGLDTIDANAQNLGIIKQSRAPSNRQNNSTADLWQGIAQTAPASSNGAAPATAPAPVAPANGGGGSNSTSNVVSKISGGIGSASNPLTPQPPPEVSGELDVPVEGNLTSDCIEIVYLPDLDEQYAVHGHNCLSKQTYGLRFEGGWKLTGVNVEADSTPVPVEFLNLINKAIQAARNVELGQINPSSITSPTTTALSGLSDMAPSLTGANQQDYVLYEMVSEKYIKPGIYRINKPWEMGQPPDAGSGLLAQLGLPTVDRTYQRIAKQGGDLATVIGDLNDAPPAPAN